MNPKILENGSDGPYLLSPTRHGEQLLKTWMEAAVEGERYRAQAQRYTQAELDAEQAFGKWLLPHDAQEGEKICMWNGPNLIQVQKVGDKVVVSIRARQGR